MNASQNVPQEITHPETGARMVLDTTQGSRALETRLTENVGIAEGGRQVLDRIRRKEEEHGHLYVDPVTGYRHRHKADDQAASSASSERAQSSSASSSSHAASSGESRDDRRARLQRELDELNQQ